jgi:hypothetical protein
MLLSIDLAKLRNAEYIQFVKDWLKILLLNNPATLNVQLQFNALQTMLTVLENIFITEQGSAITEDVNAIDLRRDRAVTGIITMVKAFTYHFDAATVKHAETIDRLLNKYGNNIARQTYQAETAIIDNLIVDLNNKPEAVAAIVALNLGNWKKELEQANTAFNAAYLQRTQQIGATTKDKLVAKRLETNEVYYKLRNFIDSYFTINEGADPYGKATNELNALIDQYNNTLAGRSNDGKGGDGETPAPPAE